MSTDDTYERWLGELDDLKLFRYAERSCSGRYGHRAMFRITNRRCAALMAKMGRLASANPSLTDVALSIVKSCNMYAAVREWEGRLFGAAAEVLSRPYYDVDAHTGPEPCRRSDAKRPYTRAEKLLVLEALRSLCDDYIGPGWCAKRLAEESGVAVKLAS